MKAVRNISNKLPDKCSLLIFQPPFPFLRGHDKYSKQFATRTLYRQYMQRDETHYLKGRQTLPFWNSSASNQRCTAYDSAPSCRGLGCRRALWLPPAIDWWSNWSHTIPAKSSRALAASKLISWLLNLNVIAQLFYYMSSMYHGLNGCTDIVDIKMVGMGCW